MKAMKNPGEDGRVRHPPPKARYKETQGKGEDSEKKAGKKKRKKQTRPPISRAGDAQQWRVQLSETQTQRGQIPTLALSSWFRDISVGGHIPNPRDRVTASPFAAHARARAYHPPAHQQHIEGHVVRTTNTRTRATGSLVILPHQRDLIITSAIPACSTSTQTLRQGPTRRCELRLAPRSVSTQTRILALRTAHSELRAPDSKETVATFAPHRALAPHPRPMKSELRVLASESSVSDVCKNALSALGGAEWRNGRTTRLDPQSKWLPELEQWRQRRRRLCERAMYPLCFVLLALALALALRAVNLAFPTPKSPRGLQQRSIRENAVCKNAGSALGVTEGGGHERTIRARFPSYSSRTPRLQSSAQLWSRSSVRATNTPAMRDAQERKQAHRLLLTLILLARALLVRFFIARAPRDPTPTPPSLSPSALISLVLREIPLLLEPVVSVDAARRTQFQRHHRQQTRVSA
ncbi:hypothetical protein DFH09DRAFT_1364184 [Mycena vulgaris]|nr:hypothetical protein DFH09DRAFT_1364184 [Mycena vulgaris]